MCSFLLIKETEDYDVEYSGSAGKESACNAGDLGWEDPLEKGKATCSSILAWRISCTVQSMGSQRVRHT